MTNILILEDDPISLQTLKKMIEKVAKDVQVSAVSDLQTARKLLHEKEEGFQAFLLDINLEEAEPENRDGFCFATEVRSIGRYAFTPIVMITSIANLELASYRKLHCYQYILKPYEEEEIRKLVKKLLFQTGDMTDVSLTVKIDGINYRISSKDIVYIKAIPRGVCLMMKKEELRVPYTSIKQLLEKLPEERFFQCHRMYVVNQEFIDYVDYVNGMIKLTMCGQIEIGVTYKKEVRRRLNG